MERKEAVKILNETSIKMLKSDSDVSNALKMGAEALLKLEQIEKVLEDKIKRVHRLSLIGADNKYAKAIFEGKEESLSYILEILKGEK